MDRGVDIGIVEDNERRIAVKFEADPLKTFRTLAHQQPAALGRAGEADLCNLRIGAQFPALRVTLRRIDEVEDAVKKTRQTRQRPRPKEPAPLASKTTV